jgi:hypothetical protein
MEQRTSVLAGIGIGLALAVIFSVANWTLNSIRESNFRQEYQAVDSAHKAVLSAVSQRSADSTVLMGRLISSWEVLFNKYRLDAPPPLTSDDSWRSSMNKINGIVRDAESQVTEGRLDEAYTTLQQFGTAWNQIFDRNTASLIGFYLLGFRDVLDTSLARAEALDYAGLDIACIELNRSWTEVRNSPVYLPKSRADEFDDYLWKEKLAIDAFCQEVAARDDLCVRDAAKPMRQGFEDVYDRYN